MKCPKCGKSMMHIPPIYECTSCGNKEEATGSYTGLAED